MITETLETRKKEAKKIARDLFYGQKVKKAIENAKSFEEIDRILTTARQNSEECPPNGYFEF